MNQFIEFNKLSEQALQSLIQLSNKCYKYKLHY